MLEIIQYHNFWNDSKYFVDMPLKIQPSEILRLWNEQSNGSKYDPEVAMGFIVSYFDDPGLLSFYNCYMCSMYVMYAVLCVCGVCVCVCVCLQNKNAQNRKIFQHTHTKKQYKTSKKKIKNRK